MPRLAATSERLIDRQENLEAAGAMKPAAAGASCLQGLSCLPKGGLITLAVIATITIIATGAIAIPATAAGIASFTGWTFVTSVPLYYTLPILGISILFLFHTGYCLHKKTSRRIPTRLWDQAFSNLQAGTRASTARNGNKNPSSEDIPKTTSEKKIAELNGEIDKLNGKIDKLRADMMQATNEGRTEDFTRLANQVAELLQKLNEEKQKLDQLIPKTD